MEDLKTPKGHFEINLPLEGPQFCKFDVQPGSTSNMDLILFIEPVGMENSQKLRLLWNTQLSIWSVYSRGDKIINRVMYVICIKEKIALCYVMTRFLKSPPILAWIKISKNQPIKESKCFLFESSC